MTHSRKFEISANNAEVMQKLQLLAKNILKRNHLGLLQFPRKKVNSFNSTGKIQVEEIGLVFYDKQGKLATIGGTAKES